jgi:hypothetical protein
MVSLFLNTTGGDDFLVRFSGQICHRNKEPTASFRELGGGTNSEEMMRWQGGGTVEQIGQADRSLKGRRRRQTKISLPRERETGMSGGSINLGFFYLSISPLILTLQSLELQLR